MGGKLVLESASIKFQRRVLLGGSPEKTSCREQEGAEGGWLLQLSYSCHNPERQEIDYIKTSAQVRTINVYVRAKAHLCVDLLWDSVLLDPGMNFGQLLSLFLAEPRLEGLEHPEFLSVFCQHLILVPGQTR